MHSVRTADQLKRVITMSNDAVIYFSAPWCGPCKVFEKICEKVEEKLGNKIGFLKVNIDEVVPAASTYQVQSVPTVVMFRNGREIMRLVGSVTLKKLEQAIEEKLGWVDVGSL